MKQPDHPRAQKTTGYVLRAILVAEEMLGRPLVAGEVVHHRNEVTDDDRPENLQVMTRSQHIGMHAKQREAWRNTRAKKLTEAKAAAIRASDEPTRVLAERYGVSMENIQMIRRGAIWKVGR